MEHDSNGDQSGNDWCVIDLMIFLNGMLMM